MVDKKYYSFTTPIGRLVSGAPNKFRTTNARNEPLKYKSGPNIGEPKREYSIGVAFQKEQVDVPAFMLELKKYAAAEWPNLFDENLNCAYPDFADKITDGDSTVMNKSRRRPADRPEWRGCWVIWFSSDREPLCVNQSALSVIKPEMIKTGYFVRIMGSCSKNTGDTPGMYMNLEGVEMSGFGPEISNRPDPREAFKQNKPAAVPSGMSATPVGKGNTRNSSQFSEGVSPPSPPSVAANDRVASRATGKVLYQGVAYDREQLMKCGWTAEQVDTLPSA